MRLTEIDKKEKFASKLHGTYDEELEQEIDRLNVENKALREICAAWSTSFQKLSAKSGLRYAETSKLLPAELYPNLPDVK